MQSLTGLQSSILRSSQAFTGIASPAIGPISVLLVQVQGLSLDSVSIRVGDLAALASNQNQIQRALLSLRDLAPLRDSSAAITLAHTIRPELIATTSAYAVAARLRS